MAEVIVTVFAVLILVGWVGGLLYIADHVVALVRRIAGKRRGVTADASAHPSRGRRAADVDPDSDRVPDPAAYADAGPVARH